MSKYKLGIDLGGSKIYAIVTDENNNILARSKAKTDPEKNVKTICRQIKETAENALKKIDKTLDDVISLGFAVPSPIDPKTGNCIHAVNLGWKDVDVKKILEKLFNKNILLENDVNCGTIAEAICGAGKEYSNVVGFFLGTGLGGGVVLNKKLIRGNGGSAGELGHEIIKYNGRLCGCGHKGCLEAYASKTGFVKGIKKAIYKKNKKSLISSYIKLDSTNIKSKLLAQAYHNGDLVVCEELQKGMKMLGVAVANLCAILGPECIVFGGGVMEALGDELMPFIKKSFVKHLFAISPATVDLKLSEFMDDSVALGAALLHDLNN